MDEKEQLKRKSTVSRMAGIATTPAFLIGGAVGFAIANKSKSSVLGHVLWIVGIGGIAFGAYTLRQFNKNKGGW